MAMSPPPMPPAPIPAMFNRSLGAMNPAPPKTWRGTIVKLNAAPLGCSQKCSTRAADGLNFALNVRHE